MWYAFPVFFHRLANMLLMQITLVHSSSAAAYFLFCCVIQFSVLAFVLIVHISFRRFIACSLYINIQRVVKKSSLVEIIFVYSHLKIFVSNKLKPTYATINRGISWGVYSKETSIYREEREG